MMSTKWCHQMRCLQLDVYKQVTKSILSRSTNRISAISQNETRLQPPSAETCWNCRSPNVLMEFKCYGMDQTSFHHDRCCHFISNCTFHSNQNLVRGAVIDSRISRIWSRFSIWNVLKKHFVSHQTHSDWLSRDDSLSSSILQLETEFLSSVFHFLKFGILDSQKLTFDFQYNNSDNLWVSFDRSIARPPRILTVL